VSSDSQREQTIKRVQHRIDVENQLLANRTTWVVTSQAFMLSAYAILVTGSIRANVNSTGASGRDGATSDLLILVRIVPWTAAISLVLLMTTIIGALLAIKRLRHAAGELEGLDHLSLIGDRPARMSGSLPSLLIPAVFLSTWIAVLVN
jgi:hypothetical protein